MRENIVNGLNDATPMIDTFERQYYERCFIDCWTTFIRRAACVQQPELFIATNALTANEKKEGV